MDPNFAPQNTQSPSSQPQQESAPPNYQSFNTNPPKKSKLVPILIGLLLVAAGVIGWLLLKKDSPKSDQNIITSFAECKAAGNPIAESYPEQCMANGQTFVNPDQKTDQQTTPQPTEQTPSYQAQTVTSGQSRFTVGIPQGWPELLRPMDSNWLLMKEGTSQPTYTAGKAVKITDLPGFGGDGQRVFSMSVYDNFAPAEGTAVDFKIPNGGSELSGNKFSIVYTDTVEGLGGHKKGEKAYTYEFKLKDGNTLRVHYFVYAADMNDQNSLIDQVVKSIVIKN